jgi:hypothetical protein
MNEQTELLNSPLLEVLEKKWIAVLRLV